MRGWRDAIPPHRNAARLGNLGRDLGSGQHAAMARLCALGELELHHLDLRIGGGCRKFLRVEHAIIGAAAEIARRDLPDQITAMPAMIG